VLDCEALAFIMLLGLDAEFFLGVLYYWMTDAMVRVSAKHAAEKRRFVRSKALWLRYWG
jgi:hypothetical protein